MARKLPHHSTHRVDGKLVYVARRFDEIHLAAGYHEQEHGEHSTAEHPLHGKYNSPAGVVTVEHVEGEPVYGLRCPCGAVAGLQDDFEAHLQDAHSGELGEDELRAVREIGPQRILIGGSITVGPEFKIGWPDGSAVTTLDADSVREYLAVSGVDLPG